MELGTNAVRNLADEEENKNAVESIQFIVIRLGDEQYGIDIRMIDNITKMQAITRIQIGRAHV